MLNQVARVYNGLGQLLFGRVIEQRWVKLDDVNNPKDRFQYAYDKDNSRLYRQNLVNTAFGELNHTGGASGGYDKLNQLTGFKRGTLNAAKDDVTTDEQGHWSTLTTDGIPQNRTHH